MLLGMIVEGNLIYDIYGPAMMMGIRNGTETNLIGPIIRNNVIRDTTEAGISVASSSMIIEGNDISGADSRYLYVRLIQKNTK